MVSCLMKFLRKTKTLQQQQQQQLQQQQQAGKQVALPSTATTATPPSSCVSVPQSNAPPFLRTAPANTSTDAARAALPAVSPHAASSSSLESSENIIVMDVADLILAAEIGELP